MTNKDEKDLMSTEEMESGKVATKEEQKKKKWLVLLPILLVVVVIGLIVGKFSSLNGDDKPKEPTDYMTYVEGIQDEFEVQVTKNGYDFKQGITWNDEYINDVVVDSTKVDLTKVGEYPLTYLIDVKGEEAEDFEKVVKVKVVKEKSKDTTATTDKKADDKKKDDKTDKTKEENKTNSSTSNNNTVSKPSNNGSSNSSSSSNNSSSSSNNNSSSSKPSNGSSGSSSSSNNKPTPTPPAHTHDWQPVTKTVNHKEEGHYETVTVEEAWDEPIYEEIAYMKCNGCGHKMYSADEYYQHRDSMEFGHGGFTDMYESILIDTIHHEAVTEKRYIVDKEAWTETVTTGYKCSCGATK